MVLQAGWKVFQRSAGLCGEAGVHKEEGKADECVGADAGVRAE